MPAWAALLLLEPRFPRSGISSVFRAFVSESAVESGGAFTPGLARLGAGVWTGDIDSSWQAYGVESVWSCGLSQRDLLVCREDGSDGSTVLSRNAGSPQKHVLDATLALELLVVWFTSQDLARTPGMVLCLAEKSGDGARQHRVAWSTLKSSGTGAWPEHRIKAEPVRNVAQFVVSTRVREFQSRYVACDIGGTAIVIA